jgi:hypothetical protein
VSVVNLRELKPGSRVKLNNGKVAEVLENPQDGMWVFGRFLDSAAGSDEEPIFAHDIVEIINAG